jgi:hypothetical protein
MLPIRDPDAKLATRPILAPEEVKDTNGHLCGQLVYHDVLLRAKFRPGLLHLGYLLARRYQKPSEDLFGSTEVHAN